MLILEMTLWQLDRSTQNAFGDGREFRSNVIQVNDLKFIREDGGKRPTLEVTSRARGSTGNQYAPTIKFLHVKFDEEDNNENVTVESPSGQLHLNKYSLKASDVQVRCTCLDFYWRFATWNMKHKSLLGDPPPPYAKMTDRAPVNPLQKPGVCKHLYRMVKQLKAKGIM